MGAKDRRVKAYDRLDFDNSQISALDIDPTDL
jgi:hypothetical protein